MSYQLCLGRDCKLGWGYNKSLNLLIPVKKEPLDVTWKVKNSWEYFVDSFSADNIPYWTVTSLLLEPTCKKLLDFQIIFNDNEYWQVHCFFYRRRYGCRKHPIYKSNCSHFVKKVNLGVEFRVQFSIADLRKKARVIKTIFQKRNADRDQQKIKCRVLINYDEIREMTLGEFMDLMQEVDEGKHLQYDIPIEFECEELTEKISETVSSNQHFLGTCLSYLYCVYRKIEMKLESVEYPHILPDLDSKEKSFENILTNIDTVRSDYMSMDKDDFLKMYPILKRLFFCYTTYIQYSINQGNDVNEGKYFPVTDSEMKSWLIKLNNWSPMGVREE